ncbi:MAG: hypothetical protein AB8B85_02560, partial [Paracoccaceae bacterium]
VEIAVLRWRFSAWREDTGVWVLLLGLPVVGVTGMAVATGWAGLGSWIALLLLITTVPAALVGSMAGLGVGALLSALALRFVTSVWHLRAGLRALPANLRRVLFLVDSAQAPELVPDIREVTPSDSFEGFLKDLSGNDNWLWKSLFVLLTLSWALPTFLYRFSLKSTIWLYVPILLTRIPAKLRDADGRRDFLARQNTTIWEWLQIVLAIGALAYAGWFALDWNQVAGLQEVRDGQTPLTPYHILLMLDLDRLAWWNVISVPAALMTVLLWVWTNHARRKGAQPMGAQITALLLAMNMRNWLAYAWCLVAVYAFVGDAWALCRFPPDFGLLLWLYGPVSCQTPVA